MFRTCQLSSYLSICLRSIVFTSIAFLMCELLLTRNILFFICLLLSVFECTHCLSFSLYCSFRRIVSNTDFFSFFIFRDRDNLADSSERDSPWSCGGGSGGGRRPLTSIIEHLRTSKSRLHNGESHVRHVYQCRSRHVSFLSRILR